MGTYYNKAREQGMYIKDMEEPKKVLVYLDDTYSSQNCLYYHDEQDYKAWIKWLRTVFPLIFKDKSNTKFKIHPFQGPGYFKFDIASETRSNEAFSSALYNFYSARSYSDYRYRWLRGLEQHEAANNLYSAAPTFEELKINGMSEEELYVFHLLKDIDLDNEK